MASFIGKFDSSKQDWETPIELFNEYNKEFSFTLDAAASELNKKVDKYIDEAKCGMKTEWVVDEVVWLNPPYRNKSFKLSDWVIKAWLESLKGNTVVILIPARTNTKWFHDYCLRFGEVRFIKGRPKFGDAKHGLTQPLCIVIFRPD